MFGYNDYFDKKKKNKPYADDREEINDWLKLIDMLVEHYVEARATGSEGLVFSRGMKMTEAEIESYYFTAPKERVSIGYNEDFAKDVREALSFITSRTEHTATEVWLPIRSCGVALDLSEDEKLALVMALSVQEDLKYSRLYGYIAGEPSMQYPTFGVYLALYESFDMEGAREALGAVSDPNEVFSKYCLDRSVIREKKRPLLHTPMVLHPGIHRYLRGLECTGAKPCDEEADRLPESYRRIADQLALTAGSGYYYLECEDAHDAISILSGMGESPIYEIDLDDIDKDEKDDEIDDRLQGALIDSTLYGCLTAVHCTDIKRLIRHLDLFDMIDTVWIYGEKTMPTELLHEKNGIMATPVVVPLPETGERLGIWTNLLSDAQLTVSDDVSIELMADTYEFSYTRIREIICEARLVCDSKGTDVIDRQTLLSVIFRYNTANFAGLATQVHTSYVWDDIEIAPSQRRRLMVACDRYRLRGRIDERYGVAKKNAYGNGVSVLMYGAPGTGKTMAAQVIANELGLPLYRIDVSQIFSKYIGETQKNLGVIFEQAKKANVILFFDEADALFAKRTDVGDSNDRYANSETAYLLQKIEEHDGMTILATNLYHNFDAAFVRRITYVARIDSPDEATRLRLWQRILPETMPISKDVDYEFLAERFEISGSSIKSILHTAAYMAGAKDRAISMADVILALKYELEKLGRIIDSSDFANYGIYLQE